MARRGFEKRFINLAFRRCRLQKAEHPGLEEILQAMCRKYIAPQYAKMTLDDFEAGIEATLAYMEFQADLVRDFSEDFYETHADIPSAVFCAVLGGPDIMTHIWRNADVREAKRLLGEVAFVTAQDPDTFDMVTHDAQYIFMIDTLHDLTTSHARLVQQPEKLDKDAWQQIGESVASARFWKFPDSLLAEAIAATHPLVYARMQQVHAAAPQVRKPAPAP